MSARNNRIEKIRNLPAQRHTRVERDTINLRNVEFQSTTTKHGDEVREGEVVESIDASCLASNATARRSKPRSSTPREQGLTASTTFKPRNSYTLQSFPSGNSDRNGKLHQVSEIQLEEEVFDLPGRIDCGGAPCLIETRSKWATAVSFAEKNLKECLASHEYCSRKSSATLPTRVIDVGPADAFEVPRLVIAAGLKDASNAVKDERYIALSYCWGKRRNFTTTSENIASLQSQIPWHELPLTITDSIEITRALGIRYLWVDALCIVQDSIEDWYFEAAKMADFYGGACLTISAALGPDVYHGLASKMNQYRSKGTNALDGEPLYKRAWALQERMLSPHVLTFGSYTSDLFWECTTRQNSEAGGRIPNALCFRLNDHVHVDDSDWFRIVRDYTCRFLTREMDKLPAISGLASRYAKLTGKSYILGLWRESLLSDLLWQQTYLFAGCATPPSIPKTYRAPSWSWASIDGNVCKLSRSVDVPWTEVINTFQDVEPILSLMEEEREWICLAGFLQHSSSSLGGKMIRDYISRFWDPSRTTGGISEYQGLFGGLIDIWYLFIASSGSGDQTNGHGLLLTKNKCATKRDFDVYKRVGKFLVDKDVWEQWNNHYDGVSQRTTLYII